MADRPGPRIYSIAAHRGFADALAAGLIPRYSDPDLGLARLTLLLPSRRAVRTVTEAFVRLSDGGLLLPRMAVVGDLDFDEALGPLLDPLDADDDILPAADPTRRWLRLAQFLHTIEGDHGVTGAALLRRAHDLATTMDRLLIEGVAPDDLLSERVIGIVGELASHWRDSTLTFLKVQAMWRAELDERGEVDAPTRRNQLFERAAAAWKKAPPRFPIVAAGVTGASPALARLLRVVSELPGGSVILPDLDLDLDADVWNALGTAGAPPGPDDPPFGRDDAVSHPQFHLKVLLNRMGVTRGEVQHWHRAGVAAARPDRSRAISNLFLPALASARWVDLPADKRRLAGVRLMETAHPGEEAQAIAILIREALETPERRVALVSPDRALVTRVVSQLRRWDIDADDTAGQPLPQTPAGRLLLLLSEVIAQDGAPVPLIALLTHPLVMVGDRRADWLDNARKLDLALRGPRPAAGLAAIGEPAARARLSGWWDDEVLGALSPLFVPGEGALLADWLDVAVTAAERLCGEALWGQADGRSLSAFVDDLRDAARRTGTVMPARELAQALRDAMDRVSVRSPWGGHPRVAIYGLLEARMTRADLVICAGLVEGIWPAAPASNALLPPAVLRALGVPGGDFRIGLSAHDLAGALGAPEVVLSWAQRDASSPVIPSRFVLRVKAMLGELVDRHREVEAVRLARDIDHAAPSPAYPRPRPDPSSDQRLVDLSVTGLDRLRSDPYQFYASSILRLRSLDPLDAAPSAAWKGTAVHAILDRWHKAGQPLGQLHATAETVLDEMSAHPLMRSLWRPRLLAALDWIAERIAAQQAEGRTVLTSELDGSIVVKGVRVFGRADRIDQLADGTLAIVDYKTGMPPSRSMVQQGYSLQLGLIGLIAVSGGFKGIGGNPAEFEYWSLARDPQRRDDAGFGYVRTATATERAAGIASTEFVEVTAGYLTDAIDRWIKGDEPFTARLNPDLPSYAEFDQLMRLDEWFGSLSSSEDVPA